MPQIIVTADRGAAFGEGAVTFRERVNVADFESEHFTAQLAERLGWAVEDASDLERPDPDASDLERPDPHTPGLQPRREQADAVSARSPA